MTVIGLLKKQFFLNTIYLIRFQKSKVLINIYISQQFSKNQINYSLSKSDQAQIFEFSNKYQLGN